MHVCFFKVLVAVQCHDIVSLSTVLYIDTEPTFGMVKAGERGNRAVGVGAKVLHGRVSVRVPG